MRTFDFAPLWRSTIGFDHLMDLADHLQQTPEENFPPYNIERSGEDSYRITLAAAGFTPDEISLTLENSALTVEGKRAKSGQREYLHRGIAARPFHRVFSLADYVQVKQASFENGLLVIDLVREIPEAMKPRRIPIGGSSPQLVQQKAA